MKYGSRQYISGDAVFLIRAVKLFTNPMFDVMIVSRNPAEVVQTWYRAGVFSAFIKMGKAGIFEVSRWQDYSGKTAMIFGEVYRYNGEWKFNAMGQGTTDGSITEMSRRFAWRHFAII